MEQHEISGFDAAMRKLEEAVTSGSEGVILKDTESNYAPGDRGQRCVRASLPLRTGVCLATPSLIALRLLSDTVCAQLAETEARLF